MKLNNTDLKKIKILNWARKNKRLPSRRSSDKKERALATKMENYLAKASLTFDRKFRDMICLEFSRKTVNKRKHGRKKRAQEVMEFLKANGRPPSIAIPEEKVLAISYINLTRPTSKVRSESFIKKAKSMDKLFKTGIKYNYRKELSKNLGRHHTATEPGKRYTYISPKSGRIFKLKPEDRYVIKALNLILVGPA